MNARMTIVPIGIVRMWRWLNTALDKLYPARGGAVIRQLGVYQRPASSSRLSELETLSSTRIATVQSQRSQVFEQD